MHSVERLVNYTTISHHHQQHPSVFRDKKKLLSPRTQDHQNSMSDAGYSVDSLDVKSKIASFEAFNETVRSVDSPERRSNAGVGSPVASSVANGAGGRSSASKKAKKNRSMSAAEHLLEEEDETSHLDSTTMVASQNRKTRLQRAMNGRNPPEPGSLMKKRLDAKERRMASLQQQPTTASLDGYSHQNSIEQRQPSSRHHGARGNLKSMKSPASVSSNRSHRSNRSNRSHKSKSSNSSGHRGSSSRGSRGSSRGSGNGRAASTPHNTTQPAQSPNVGASATAAAQQHRASHYSDNYSGGQQQLLPHHHQHHDQSYMKLSSSGSGGDTDSLLRSNSSKGGGPSISRFHKLKMKGMDHARLAQKRKQAAQRNTNSRNEVGQGGNDNNTRMQSSPTMAQRSSPRQQQQQQHQHQQHQQQSHSNYNEQQLASGAGVTNGDPHSPDHHAMTDDDTTLVSVARIVDQEQAFARQRNSSGGGTPTHQQHTMIGSNGGIEGPKEQQTRLWVGGEEKSDKAMMEQGSSRMHHNSGGGIYPRPSSSSEFEPEIQPRISSQYASLSKSGGATPSPQHSSSRQHQRQLNRQHQQGPLQQQQQQQQQQHHASSNQQQHYHTQLQYQAQGGGSATNSYHHASPSHHQQQYSPPQAAATMSPQDRVGSGGLLRRSGGSYPSQQFYQSASNRLDDDDRTFDYGVKDDDSQGSTTFQQQLLEAERKAREQSHLSEGNTTMSQPSDSMSRRQGRSRNNHASPLLKTDDPLEQYRQSMDTPVMKTTCGVIGAATIGCVVIGPVGMLLGAAAVGIGVGVMQIPEEQRSNMANKASHTLKQVEEQAYAASESLSNSCATTYKDSGISEHIPAEMSKFCAPSEDDVDPAHAITHNIKSQDSEAVRLDQVTGACGGGVGGDNLPMLKNQDSRKPASPNQSRSLRNKKVACLRHVSIRPVNEIHGLDPASQPRAWLEVLASADTSNDEKMEAMEEILILAKDKQRTRIFLEEGILDSLMWLLCRFFEKQNRKPTDEWANPEITPEERNAARLAARCCVTLGKTHCAAVHTEGDLELMGRYERGAVPEERQLAQMLFEVPHHTRATKTNDPTIIDPSMEVFALKQLTLTQAEEIAATVKALADER